MWRVTRFSIFSVALSFGAVASECPTWLNTLLLASPIHPVSAYRHVAGKNEPGLARILARQFEFVEPGDDTKLPTFAKLGPDEFIANPGQPLLIKLNGKGGTICGESGVAVGFWNPEIRNRLARVSTEVPAHAKEEVKKIRERAAQYERQRQDFWDTVSAGPRLLFYPHVLTQRAITALVTGRMLDGKRVLRAAFGRALRDGILVAGYYLLVDTGTHPSIVFVQALDKWDGIIGIDDYLEETDKMLGEKPEGITLFVDGIEEEDGLADSGPLLYERLYGKDKNAFYIKVKDMADLAAQVKAYAEKTNQKIARIELLGHGNHLKSLNPSDGSAAIWHVGSSTATVDIEKARLITERGLAIVSSVLKKTPEERAKAEEELKKVNEGLVAIDSFPDLSQYFAPGAQMRFISCKPGAGSAGKEFMLAIGKKMVAGNLGKVASATRSIRMSEADMSPEKRQKVKDAEEDIKKWLAERAAKRGTTGKVLDVALEHAMLPLEFLHGGLTFLFEENPGDPVQVYDFKTKRWTTSNKVPVSTERF